MSEQSLPRHSSNARIAALRLAIDRALASSSLSLPVRDALTRALIDDGRAAERSVEEGDPLAS